jgi:hypothetical protein
MYPLSLIYLVEAQGSFARTSLFLRFHNDGQRRLSRRARSTRPRKISATSFLAASY